MPIILAIESSCDDTSAAIMKDGVLLANFTAGQKVHADYGGVIPELASRQHMKNIISVVDIALDKANINKSQIDAIAVTQGPGLLGSLVVGVTFAKGMALGLNIPLIAVNHMEAHILSHFIDAPRPKFPFICLTVSGGHTQLVVVRDYDQFEILGETIDDAAGEAFDKCGKMLGLPYPSGPHIDKLAKRGRPIFEFSKPKVGEFEFSFSGLKTSVLYFLQKEMKKNPDFIKSNLNDLCCSIQQTIVSILVDKLEHAAKRNNINQVAIAGGVSANSLLREEIERVASHNNWSYYIPTLEYCMDNAAMIAIVGHHKFIKEKFAEHNLTPNARLKMKLK